MKKEHLKILSQKVTVKDLEAELINDLNLKIEI